MMSEPHHHSTHGTAIIKQEPFLYGWESPDGINSARDHLTIKKEEFSLSEDFPGPSPLNIEKTEDEGEAVSQDDAEFLYELDSPDGISSSTDPLSIKKEEHERDEKPSSLSNNVDIKRGPEFSPSEYFPGPSTLNIEKTEDEGEAMSQDDAEELKYEVELTSSGSAAEGTVAVGAEDNIGSESTGGLTTKYEANRNLKWQSHVHLDQRPYSCNVRVRSFSNSNTLKYRTGMHTGKKPYECEVCQLKFTNKSNLRRHLFQHAGEKPYECEVCQRKFACKSNLRKHFLNHMGEKPYECEVCQRKFAKKSTLTLHFRLHTGEKPYECDVCQRKFARKSYLSRHCLQHTAEKSYKCEVCQRKFAKKFTLTKHLRQHTGEKPYECEVCRRKFTSKSKLRKHFCHHTGEKRYECDFCQYRFAQKTALETHLLQQTGEKP